MKYLLMTLATACAVTISCERHEFEGKHGTKQLHEHAAGHGDSADHVEKPAH